MSLAELVITAVTVEKRTKSEVARVIRDVFDGDIEVTSLPILSGNAVI